MKQRKIPLRKCTGCQEMKNKKELIRIVRNDEGLFFLDETGKKAGRGAYICPNIECLKKAEKSKGLEKSFKSAVPKEVYEKLKEQLEKLQFEKERALVKGMAVKEGTEKQNG